MGIHPVTGSVDMKSLRCQRNELDVDIVLILR